MNRPTDEEIEKLTREEFGYFQNDWLNSDAIEWQSGYKSALSSPYVRYLEERVQEVFQRQLPKGDFILSMEDGVLSWIHVEPS